MQIVIDIPEDSYKATCNGCMLPPDVENVVQGIKNGTPLSSSENPNKWKSIYEQMWAEIEDAAFDLQEIDGEHKSFMVVDLNDVLNIIDKHKSLRRRND